ncbi:hypothetical protein [uncultured Parabacteroides sp.]|jgi:hypothetical protein|uniref:hypothetical protein n=1 Tax=uncultured Parabacteroides sp. TaxID=512312 RepID=UPI0025FE806F|nr:hypothetical protein [uncultured Parabacteroides sp.]
MLKYYSYYSVGGYKDMYLGNSETSEERTYYLPLLDIWKEQVANGDKKNEIRLIESEKVKKIAILTADESFGLPEDAAPLFSHGAYKLIYKVANTGEGIFAIRDISCETKDENGRSIPFLLAVVADTKTDRNTLECIAAYAAMHLSSFCETLSYLFEYDPKFNGLAFRIDKMNELIKKAIAEGKGDVESIEGMINLHETAQGQVGLLLMPKGITPEKAAEEQNAGLKSKRIIPISSIVPLDNPEEARRLREMAETIAQKKRKIRMALTIGGVGIVLIALITWLIAERSRV